MSYQTRHQLVQAYQADAPPGGGGGGGGGGGVSAECYGMEYAVGLPGFEGTVQHSWGGGSRDVSSENAADSTALANAAAQYMAARCHQSMSDFRSRHAWDTGLMPAIETGGPVLLRLPWLLGIPAIGSCTACARNRCSCSPPLPPTPLPRSPALPCPGQHTHRSRSGGPPARHVAPQAAGAVGHRLLPGRHGVGWGGVGVYMGGGGRGGHRSAAASTTSRRLPLRWKDTASHCGRCLLATAACVPTSL